ncbi:response regulator [Deferrisoma camini]|uniref:response regulator n=1 Tax=Deferrisoma camini TaxID=1035120 RepID=UPI00046CFD3F|nr:response regulator [Deferrisoma camini]
MRRALIVDDAVTVRMYHRQILEGAGFEVDEAENGVEALEKALVTSYDLLLVDVNMPKMDGYTFLKEVRGTPELRAVPAIMISTEAERRDKEQAYRAGANLYLVKPVRPEALALRATLMTARGGSR